MAKRGAGLTRDIVALAGLRVRVDEAAPVDCHTVVIEHDGKEYRITPEAEGRIVIHAIQSALFIRPVTSNKILCSQGPLYTVRPPKT